ncbi:MULTISPECIES: phage tail spike protein [unclassified Clostridium]|uniref:phage tail spike protein n=1 Tax=Clostridium sp. UMB9555A TaxID=3050593 RepID=UPI00254B7565|nr:MULTISPECIES: phage tail spike protein [unclassified Clostridium]MDK7589923.1 phage tail spike protein [Clostridium sp. UMB9555B]MDK7627683.1 phage tail spike protein [Clostridium sp. UMB9555A]
MIQLYKQNNKNYYMNGDMILKPIEATIRMELNGLWEVNLVHPFDKKGRWKSIGINDVIKVDLPWGEDLYYIYDLDDSSDEGVIVNCKHIFFKLNKTYCKNVNDTKNLYDVRPTNCNAKVALNTVFAGTNFRGESNITNTNTSYFIRKSILEAVVGNDDNSILNRWGGELFLNNYTVTLNHRIGTDHGVKCKYGNNSVSFKRNRNSEDIITRAIIVMYDGLMLPEQYVDSPLINNYPEIYEGIVEFDDIKVKESPEDKEGFNTKEEAFEEARKRIKEVFKNNHIDLPKITFEVDMINKSNSLKGIVKDGYIVNLGDTITAEHEMLGIDIKTRAIAIEMDLLTQKYTNITLSNESLPKSNLIDSVNTIDKITTSNGGVKANALEGMVDALKTKFGALRDIAQPQEVRAMLFEDKIKGSRTYGALALGTSGIMIASKRLPDDSDWDWRTFIGGGYAYADELIGILRTVLITNMDKSFQIDLNKSGGAIFKNNEKVAIEIVNNMINLYNYMKDEDYIGGLMSLIDNKDPDKPVIALGNDFDSAMMLTYPLDNSKHSPYITLDKFGVLGTSYPIMIYEESYFAKVARLFKAMFGEYELYNTSADELILRMKQGGKFFVTDNNFYSKFHVGEDSFSVLDFFKNSGSNDCWCGYNFFVDRNFHSNGDISCSGAKNRIVDTEHYGKIKMNAYETTECHFGDIGRDKLVNGKCILRIDERFLETVNTNIQYEVKTWAYGNGNVWVETKDMYPQYVIVKGNNDIEFGYEIIAKQKGYENKRMEEYIKLKTLNIVRDKIIDNK